jgi:hypothetical protein
MRNSRKRYFTKYMYCTYQLRSVGVGRIGVNKVAHAKGMREPRH